MDVGTVDGENGSTHVRMSNLDLSCPLPEHQRHITTAARDCRTTCQISPCQVLSHCWSVSWCWRSVAPSDGSIGRLVALYVIRPLIEKLHREGWNRIPILEHRQNNTFTCEWTFLKEEGISSEVND